MMRQRLAAVTLAVLAGVACDAEPRIVPASAIEHGAALFASRSTSPAANNLFACATCHRAQKKLNDQAILPGVRLAGALTRASYWGGSEPDLLRAINHCRKHFQRAKLPWTPSDDQARALYAWLGSLPAELPTAVTMSFVGDVADPPGGDAKAGGSVYAQACAHCHGAAFSGKGRLAQSVPALPQQTRADHPGYSPAQLRLVFVEKVRHGPFFGYGGSMPPFAREVLSDAQLADVLAYLQLAR